MPLILPIVAATAALLAPLAQSTADVGHDTPTTQSTVVSVGAASVSPALASGSTVHTNRPLVSGKASGATQIALVRGNELMGTGVVQSGGYWQLNLHGTLTTGVNHMELLAVTPAGKVTSPYVLTLAPASTGAVRTATVSTAASLGWANLLTKSVTGARPTVDGVATPGARLELRDSLGNVYGAAVADEEWDFRMQLTRDLKVGANQLVLTQALGTQSGYTPVQIVRAG
ncbi:MULTISPECIES: hypothetical protein [unclassified Curtobacterium]|uniref:hypothetical protein n=1 Tax=unclassified Curtobacterium TaxID=257496 RepID=UPI000349FE3D|nr:hypothetical protein [Curtobacterium sp. B18]